MELDFQLFVLSTEHLIERKKTAASNFRADNDALRDAELRLTHMQISQHPRITLVSKIVNKTAHSDHWIMASLGSRYNKQTMKAGVRVPGIIQRLLNVWA